MGMLDDSIVILATAPVVIGKRMMVFAGGGRKTGREGRRAVMGKVDLAARSAASLAMGGSWRSWHSWQGVLRSAPETVQANARRL